MKISLTCLALFAVASCATGPDGKPKFNLPPIKAKVCYLTPQGSICAGTDGKAVVIEGNFEGDATLIIGKK